MGRKYDPAMKHLLLSEDRSQRLDPYEILRAFDVKPGMVLADLGCGPGFFTLPAAELVGPTGLVYAVDVQQEMVDALRSRLAQAEVKNVVVRRSSEVEPSLPLASVDLAILAYMLHEVEQRAKFLLATKRLLKSDGRIVVINWKKTDTPVGPPMEVRLAPEDVINDAKAVGLNLLDGHSLNDYDYLLMFNAR
ncbi:MAG TPA: class I SAM-dependent methyltransferase [Ktedonobacterales bacterium]|jgi:ubiquinone/menaquinone biosynthesis C-methylase UbiE